MCQVTHKVLYICYWVSSSQQPCEAAVFPYLADEETETYEAEGLARGCEAISWKKQVSTAVPMLSQHIFQGLKVVFLGTVMNKECPLLCSTVSLWKQDSICIASPCHIFCYKWMCHVHHFTFKGNGGGERRVKKGLLRDKGIYQA